MMSYWFVFCGEDILLEKSDSGTFTIPFRETPPTDLCGHTHILNVSPMDDGNAVKTYSVDNISFDTSKYAMCGLRQSYYKLSEPLYQKAGKCYELTYWDGNTRFCGVCGATMTMNTDISKVCTRCGKEIWPQLSTAIIVLINKGDDLLLVRANNFKGNFFGLIAGFVETGETLEEAVTREVMEETSLTIKNIRYYSSQPWPYPCGLMVGFYAEYESGEIRLQETELRTGGWFNKNNLPQIPEKLSLARRLIDHWLETHNNNEMRGTI